MKSIALTMMLLIAGSAFGMDHKAAGACDHTATMEMAAQHVMPDCHHEMETGSMEKSHGTSCHCEAMLSCTALILPETMENSGVSRHALQLYFPSGDRPDEYLAGITSPPPRTMI